MLLEQYKVDALRGAIKALIKDCVSAVDEEIVIHLSDSDIRRFIDSLDGIIGKEHHDNK